MWKERAHFPYEQTSPGNVKEPCSSSLASVVTHLATNMSVDSVADELASLPGALLYALMLLWPAQGLTVKPLLELSACKMYNRDQRSGRALAGWTCTCCSQGHRLSPSVKSCRWRRFVSAIGSNALGVSSGA